MAEVTDWNHITPNFVLFQHGKTFAEKTKDNNRRKAQLNQFFLGNC
jgi:hypothetical protein